MGKPAAGVCFPTVVVGVSALAADPRLAKFLSDLDLSHLLRPLQEKGIGLLHFIRATRDLQELYGFGLNFAEARRVLESAHVDNAYFDQIWDGTWLESGFVDPAFQEEVVEVHSPRYNGIKFRLHKLPGSSELQVQEAMPVDGDLNKLFGGYTPDKNNTSMSPSGWLRTKLPSELVEGMKSFVPSLRLLPIDDKLFAIRRKHLRYGALTPPMPCQQKVDASLAAELLTLLQQPTRLWINIGAGDGLGGDPLQEFISPRPSEDWNVAAVVKGPFRGVAVEADEVRHARLVRNVRCQNTSIVISICAKVTPENVWHTVRDGLVATKSHLSTIADGRIKIDFLKVDIDSYDCIIVQKLLEYVAPSFIYLEINAAIPPPFKFARHYHEAPWDFDPTNYSVFEAQRWSPSFSCSLSYAVWGLAHWSTWLLRMDGGDLVFVHSSLASAVAGHFGVRVPYDEIACYRGQFVWSPFPISYVREWFFVPDLNTSQTRLLNNLTLADTIFKEQGHPWSLHI